MPALRVAIRKTYERLFPDVELLQHTREPENTILSSDSEDEDRPAERPTDKTVNYGDQVSQLFDQALNDSVVASEVRKALFISVKLS
jgi:hypothetical protein